MSTTSYFPATALDSDASAVSRAAILLYGVTAYLFFLAVITYAIGFVGGFVVPKHIESGRLVDLPARSWSMPSSSPCSQSSTA